MESRAEEVILDNLHATAFQYSPLGRTILGPVNNIKKITKAHIQDYVSNHYAAHRMVRVCVRICCNWVNLLIFYFFFGEKVNLLMI